MLSWSLIEIFGPNDWKVIELSKGELLNNEEEELLEACVVSSPSAINEAKKLSRKKKKKIKIYFCEELEEIEG